MTADEEIRLGDRAASLLGDEVLSRVFMTLTDDCVTRWRNSPARDSEGRERLWMAVQNVDMVRKELERLRDAGHMARMKIEGERAAREKEAEFRRQIARDLDIPEKYLDDGQEH